jgi:hypothetical protein
VYFPEALTNGLTGSTNEYHVLCWSRYLSTVASFIWSGSTLEVKVRELCGVRTLAHAHGKIWDGAVVCSRIDLSELACPYPPFITRILHSSTSCCSSSLSVAAVGSRSFVRSVQYLVRHRSSCLRLDFLVLLVFLGECQVRPTRSTTGTKTKIIGHHAEFRAIDDETSEVLVKDMSFKWKPGQYIYLRLPTMGPLESHPFKIGNNCD